MGRTTPSHRMALIKEYLRIKKLVEEFPQDERKKWLELLDGFEDTMTRYNNVVFNDPFEAVVIHLIRKIVSRCSCR